MSNTRALVLSFLLLLCMASVPVLAYATACDDSDPCWQEPPQLRSVYLPVVTVDTPTPTPVAGPCACTGDLYNCADFESQYAAQQCYNWCMVQGLGDPHRIDRDADGVACERN